MDEKLDFFVERVAILEFDAGFERLEAEERAKEMADRLFPGLPMEEILNGSDQGWGQDHPYS